MLNELEQGVFSFVGLSPEGSTNQSQDGALSTETLLRLGNQDLISHRSVFICVYECAVNVSECLSFVITSFRTEKQLQF